MMIQADMILAVVKQDFLKTVFNFAKLAMDVPGRMLSSLLPFWDQPVVKE
jgi:hypothetical protein